MKSLLERQLDNLIFMRELMRAGKKDTAKVDADIARIRAEIKDRSHG